MKTLCMAGMLLAGVAGALAGDVVLGVNGKTRHQIVVPDEYANPIARASVEYSARLIQEVFATNAITMEIVAESRKDADKHGIYLGATRFAAEHGVDISRLDGWQNIHKAVGKHVIIAGNDMTNPIQPGTPVATKIRVPYYVTLHSTAEFLYRYAGARFLKPGDDGIEFLPVLVVSVPDDLNTIQEPYFREHDWGYYKDDIYLFNIANHAVKFQKIWSMWGHQHPVAVPYAKYGQSHPDYFIQSRSLRVKNTDHLCYSNEEVRELIYKHILEKCDEGYEIVEVGQPDGFVPCGCEACHDLYGIKPGTCTHGAPAGFRGTISSILPMKAVYWWNTMSGSCRSTCCRSSTESRGRISMPI
ncbi:MAG: hypothetical protein LC725_12495 [Lentisphaerae bacterium]|nr:hypothetical protein [Lentisphaerota bacterium]